MGDGPGGRLHYRSERRASLVIFLPLYFAIYDVYTQRVMTIHRSSMRILIFKTAARTVAKL